MRLFLRRACVGAALLGALAATAGCSRIRGHQGYLLDNTLVATVQPGVDNKASVQRMLGRPSFTGQFSEADWYYVSRDTRGLPKASWRVSRET